MDIDELAYELKSEFIIQKRKKAKGYNLAAGALHASFVKAAEVVLELEAKPDIYILAQFHGQDDNAKLLPQYLSTALARERYVKFMEEMFSTEITYDMIYKENVNRLNAQKKFGFSEEEILCSMSFKFAPWFRLCYSVFPIKKLMDDDILREKALRGMNIKLKQFLADKKMDYKRITYWAPKEARK